MIEIPRDFKGIWIPKQIWLDQRLTYFERCLFAEIDSLNGKNGCFASNEYLAKFFNERERKIQEGISKLKELGYVYQESFDGRTRILRTQIPENDKSKFSTSDMRDENRHAEFNTAEVLKNDLSNTDLYITYSKEDNKEENKQKAPAAHGAKAPDSNKKSLDSFSLEVQQTSQEMLAKLQQAKPDFKVKNIFQFLEVVDYMIRIDKRIPQKILEVLSSALSDDFWCPKLFKPNPAKYLRENFDQLEMQAKPKKIKNPFIASTSEGCKQLAEEIKKRVIK